MSNVADILQAIRYGYRDAANAVVRNDKIYINDLVITRKYGLPMDLSFFDQPVKMTDDISAATDRLISRVDKIYTRRMRTRARIQKFSDKITKNHHTDNMTDDEFTATMVLTRISDTLHSAKKVLLVHDVDLARTLRTATNQVVILHVSDMYQIFVGNMMLGHIPNPESESGFVISGQNRTVVIKRDNNPNLFNRAQNLFWKIYTRHIIPGQNRVRNLIQNTR